MSKFDFQYLAAVLPTFGRKYIWNTVLIVAHIDCKSWKHWKDDFLHVFFYARKGYGITWI